MKVLITLAICIGSAYLGQVVFGDIPMANWLLGSLTGIVSLAVWLVE